jgi:CheY-like chemotaxis protein
LSEFSVGVHPVLQRVVFPAEIDIRRKPAEGGVMNDRSLPTMILLVDDDPAMRTLLTLRLERLGHGVLEAGSVAEAVSLLERGDVTAVLSDHGMPGGTGLQLLAYVRNRTPEARFVLMSGLVTSEMEAAAWSGGAEAVVSKDDLARTLHVLFPPGRRQLALSA